MSRSLGYLQCKYYIYICIVNTYMFISFTQMSKETPPWRLLLEREKEKYQKDFFVRQKLKFRSHI